MTLGSCRFPFGCVSDPDPAGVKNSGEADRTPAGKKHHSVLKELKAVCNRSDRALAERTAALDALHSFCDRYPDPQYAWTPHVTILIDEPQTVCEALPLLLKSFHPFTGRITRLHLCAFWPTREVFSAELKGKN